MQSMVKCSARQILNIATFPINTIEETLHLEALSSIWDTTSLPENLKDLKSFLFYLQYKSYTSLCC